MGFYTEDADYASFLLYEVLRARHVQVTPGDGDPPLDPAKVRLGSCQGGGAGWLDQNFSHNSPKGL